MKYWLASAWYAVLNSRDAFDVADGQDDFFFHLLADCIARNGDFVAINLNIQTLGIKAQFFQFVLQRRACNFLLVAAEYFCTGVFYETP